MSKAASPGESRGLIVVKIGGSTLGSHDTSLADVAALSREGARVVVIHGGGDTVTSWLERHGVESRFVRGLRATDAQALEVVIAVLAGLVNRRLVAQLNALGARAVGISGADGALLRARRRPELGFVGDVTAVDRSVLDGLLSNALLPVVASIAVEEAEGRPTEQLLNVNADTVAGELALAMGTNKLIFLTDVAGVLDRDGRPLERLSSAEAERLLAEGTVAGGMIPKVQAGLSAAGAGVRTLIIDGREEHALAAALAGQVSGTVIG